MLKNLGILRMHSLHFATRDMARMQRMMEQQFGFIPMYRSSKELSERTQQEAIVFGAGDARFVVSQPLSLAGQAPTSKAARYLERHPEGVMSVSFLVQDLDHTLRTLESRGGTIISDPKGDSSYRDFEIATPLGDVQFRFIQAAPNVFIPGFERLPEKPASPLGWQRVDHITVNLRTMKPFVDWLASVMGWKQFWQIEFHTAQTDAGKHKESGSGLKSIVMWDEDADVKIATNEPLRPFFKSSQIEKFVADNRGAGVQHIAVSVPAIIPAVDALKKAGLVFLEAPPAYYERLPKRFADLGFDVTRVKERIQDLQQHNILVDGSSEGYMLQIFTDEVGMIQKEGGCPAFFEVIQREGDRGFGYGNFRALFEAIESLQNERA